MLNFNDFGNQAMTFLGGGTAVLIVSHAVNTFPMPKSAIGRWFLGVIQFAVGQRLQGNYTLNGGGTAQAALDTAVAKVAANVADKVVLERTFPGPLSPTQQQNPPKGSKDNE